MTAPAAVQPPPDGTWVHSMESRQIGSVIGWRSEDSPTGFWSGIVDYNDHNALRVRVRNVLPGIVERPEGARPV